MTVSFPKARPERARKGVGRGREKETETDREIETEICLVARRAYVLQPQHSVP